MVFFAKSAPYVDADGNTYHATTDVKMDLQDATGFPNPMLAESDGVNLVLKPEYG